VRAAFALILIVVRAGCGGGDDARDEFVKQADANCRQRQQAELALQDRSEEEWAEDPDAAWRVYDREHEKQSKLEAPEELADDWRRYLELLRSAIETQRELADPDHEYDLDRDSVAGGEANKSAVQARQVAKRMGLKVCANAFY
jgi:hypothetical protein